MGGLTSTFGWSASEWTEYQELLRGDGGDGGAGELLNALFVRNVGKRLDVVIVTSPDQLLTTGHAPDRGVAEITPSADSLSAPYEEADTQHKDPPDTGHGTTFKF